MTHEEWQDSLSGALQSDLENGVRWLNEKAADEFKRKYPELNKWIGEFMRAAHQPSAARCKYCLRGLPVDSSGHHYDPVMKGSPRLTRCTADPTPEACPIGMDAHRQFCSAGTCRACVDARAADNSSPVHVHTFTMGVCACGERSDAYLYY